MKKLTLTIGIPAYNEEANIALLLSQLLCQRRDGYILDKILVYSDGSHDRTDEIVRSFAKHDVLLIKSEKRRGKMYGIGRMSSMTTADALVLLDADTSITDLHFLTELVTPIQKNNADLVSVRVRAITNATFLEKILEFSMEMKRAIFEKYNQGNNIYTCHGRARVLSKKFYTALSYPKNIAGEDAYMYLFAKKHKFNYAYVTSTEVLYKLPSRIADHKKQSIRFIKMRNQLVGIFGTQYVVDNFKLPFGISLLTALSYFAHNPLYGASYLFIHIYTTVKSITAHETSSLWPVATSSKKMKGAIV